jgi:hypothetical protein
MHPDWWGHFDLAQWRASYTDFPACRAPIDRLINQRRGFPVASLPAQLDRQQTALLALNTRFAQLILALGMMALDCQDYLLMKPYRTVLARQFGLHGCDQLYGLKPVWQGSGRDLLAPEQVPAAAFAAGARWFEREARACIVQTLLATQLPPPGDVKETDRAKDRAATTHASAAMWLLKIGRFL